MTHAIDFLQFADSIVIMDKGSIVAQGSFNQLKEDNNSILMNFMKINKLNNEQITKPKEDRVNEINSEKTNSSSKLDSEAR